MSRYLSYAQLDTIAGRVVRAYRKLPEVQAAGAVHSVDPQLLLTKLLGLSVAFRHISRDGETLGMTSYEELEIEIFDKEEEFFSFDGKTVLIEKNLLSERQTGRRNFTIMHEGCHHVLRMLYPRDYASGANARRVLRYRCTGEGWSREEWQVDRLTSSILMPRELVKQAMIRVGQRGRIKWLCPDSEAYGRFCGMSELLGVSKQALCIRMMGMGLIEEAELYRPYGVDVLAGDDFDG